MSLKLVAIVSALLLALCLSQVLGAATTVRPYKFGFTIDEQQHRQEKRDERGIVMGEFGFITADGIYHVTVYATDEEGKFRIISMKSYPYNGPIGSKTVSAATTPRVSLPASPAPPRHNFNTEACSGCFLKKTPVKTEIRTLSQPLAPAPADSATSTGSSGAAGQSPTGRAPSYNNGGAVAGAAGGSFPLGKSPVGGASGKPQLGSAGKGGVSGVSGGSGGSGSPGGFGGSGKSGVTGLSGAPGASAGSGSAFGASGEIGGGAAGRGSGSGTVSRGETGDLYKFKYLLDYNGHEETGSRNGDKQGSYFAIGEDAVQRTIEYIANEFGFQPHVSWKKLDEKKEAALPEENSLKHYEFKWFN